MSKILVSVFKSAQDASNPFHRAVEICLQRIIQGNSKELVEKFRLTKEDKYKKQLPGVCFNGTFSHRANKNILEPSGLMIVDFDKFPDLETLNQTKQQLINLPYIFSVFISPSGSGLKALVKIPKDADNFKGYFNAFMAEIDSPYFDKSTKDISRFCYESYDPELYYNPDAIEYDVIEVEEYTEIGSTYSDVIVPLKSESQIIDRLTTWFNKSIVW